MQDEPPAVSGIAYGNGEGMSEEQQQEEAEREEAAKEDREAAVEKEAEQKEAEEKEAEEKKVEEEAAIDAKYGGHLELPKAQVCELVGKDVFDGFGPEMCRFRPGI